MITAAHAALAVTVTVCPLAIVTISADVGIMPPTHVDGLFQVPELPETIGAAYTCPANARSMMQKAFNCFIESFGFNCSAIATIYVVKWLLSFFCFF